jgi:HK97 family phage major capsid protein
VEDNKEILALTEQVKNLGGTVKEAVEKAQSNIAADVDTKLSAKADAEEVKSLRAEVKELKAAKGSSFGAPEVKSFSVQLKEAIEAGAKQYAEKGGNIEIQLKTAITGSNFTNDTTNNTRVIGEQREAGINKLPQRSPFVRELAFNGSASSDTISWTEKVSESGVPITLAELDTYPEETSSYQQFSTQVKKIGGMTKVSEEKLSDVEWMLNEIQSELLQRHDLVVDTQLLSGTGLTTNLKGVLEYAQTFAAGSFAVLVPNPNRADVLRVAYNQIVIEQFQPNAIVMHPTDVAWMELEKDATTSQYILPPFVSANGMTVKGLPVVVNTGITAGTFLMGDFTRLGVFAKGGAILEIGRDSNDFSTDQLTVKLRERIAARIKGRDVKAFVKGTFSTAITAIRKP